MGDKIQAKKIAKEFGLPVIEGSEGGVKDINDAKKIWQIGLPVLIKAAGGGGGKGMKIVKNKNEFANLFLTAKSEAKKYFGNDEVYIEKFESDNKLQILNGKNRVVHLHERDWLFKEDIKNLLKKLQAQF